MKIIRNVKQDEWKDLMHFLDRCYGHEAGFFGPHYPHLFAPDVIRLENHHVIEKNGRIVAHVGFFPLRSMADGIELTIGGIGGVGTLPEERGQGHMQALFRHVIGRMREEGTLLSVLWGSRQRYAHFGYETAGERVTMEFTERSFRKAGIEPSLDVREIAVEDAWPEVGAWHTRQLLRVIRDGSRSGALRRPGLRVWTSENGYVAGQTNEDSLVVREAVSASGRETSLVLAAMQQENLAKAQASVSRQDASCVARLLVPADSWTIRPEGMFRINDLCGLLTTFQPLLQRRAAALRLPDFALSFGARFGNDVDVAAIRCEAGVLHVTRDKTPPYIEIEFSAALRLLLGGPVIDTDRLTGFPLLLPLPVCIPPLDRV